MSRWKTAILCSFFAINLLIAVFLTIPLVSNTNSNRTLQFESNDRIQDEKKHATESRTFVQSLSKSYDNGHKEAGKSKPYNISQLSRTVNHHSVNLQNNVGRNDFGRQTTTNLYPKYVPRASKASEATLKSFQSRSSTYLREKTPENQIHEYILKPRSDFCNESTTTTPTLLIAVCSSVLNFELRQAIRSTWGREGAFEPVVNPANAAFEENSYHKKSRILFVVALPDERNTRLQSYVNSESSVYGDVLQLNFPDHYANLTLKTLGAMRWATEECRSASFFLKADDDVFVNVPKVIQLISSSAELISGRDVIVGHVMHDARPVRDRKSTYYTPYAVFRESIFPPYTSGSGYLLSFASIARLLTHSFKKSTVFWLEDIYFTGMLAKELGFTLVHDSRFNYSKKRQDRYRDACWFQEVITEHGLTPEDLYQISIDASWMKNKGDFSDRTLRSRNCTIADEKRELSVRDLMSRT